MEYFVYIGTYTATGSKGIYGYRFNAITGDSSRIGLVAEAENPSFLATHPNGKFLYAVNEVGTFEGKVTGAVSTFAIDPTTGELKLLGQVASMGSMPAYVSLDKLGGHALVANYDGGSVAVFPVAENGLLGAASAFVKYTGSGANIRSPKSSHAHAIRVANDNRFAIAADLGLDQLLIYRFDASEGSLTPSDPKSANLNPGAGPRHLAFHPNGTLLYVVNELDSTVAVFFYEARTGTLRNLQTISTLPEGFAGLNSTAEILVDQKGRFLYVSNRGHDSIAVFAVDSGTGTLAPVEHISTGGKTPRNFALDPTGSWLFAANQDSNNVVLFRMNQDSGRLTVSPHVLQAVSPVCIRFVPMLSAF